MYNDPPFRPPTLPDEGEQYRLYFLDGHGHITKSHEFFAVNDEAAMKTAEAWRHGHRIELWQRARIVKRWESEPRHFPD